MGPPRFLSCFVNLILRMVGWCACQKKKERFGITLRLYFPPTLITCNTFTSLKGYLLITLIEKPLDHHSTSVSLSELDNSLTCWSLMLYKWATGSPYINLVTLKLRLKCGFARHKNHGKAARCHACQRNVFLFFYLC